MKNKKFAKYFREYEWSNISAMIRNNRSGPKICTEDFNNKLVVITGTTSGIGCLTAKKYASKGADLLCINRNEKKSEALRLEIESEFGVKCDYKIADLSNLKDILHVADELLKLNMPIDFLIHNAGIYLTRRELTPDGLEKVFVIQHLSSFIINYILMAVELSQIQYSTGFLFKYFLLDFSAERFLRKAFPSSRKEGMVIFKTFLRNAFAVNLHISSNVVGTSLLKKYF